MNSRLDCQRFGALLDISIQGEAPTCPDEKDFWRLHLDSCPNCARQAAVFEQLRLLDQYDDTPQPTDAVLELKARQVLAREAMGQRQQQYRIKGWIFAGVGSLAATAAAIVWLFVLWGEKGGAPALTETAKAPNGVVEARISWLAGRVTRGNRKVAVGDVVRPGDGLNVGAGEVLVEFDNGTAALVKRKSQLSLVNATSQATRFQLGQGIVTFRVAPLTAEQAFVVDTRAGQAKVLGTVFSVSSTQMGDELRVAEGKVYYQTVSGQGVVIAAGEAFNSAHGLRDLTKSEVESVGQGLSHNRSSLPETRWKDKKRPGSRKGMHQADRRRVTGRAKKQTESESDGTLTPYGTSYGTPLGTGGGIGAEHHKDDLWSEHQSSVAPPIAELLAQARDLRKKGQWSELVAVYRKIIGLHGAAPEAQICLVLMGKVQLEQMKDARAALLSFKSYLQNNKSGSLAEEAEWGIAVALRHLELRDREIRALEDFRKRYPKSLYAPLAEKRLSAIR